MKKKQLHTILTYVIAFVWLINGLLCKVLNIVPRHKDIVSTILGNTYSDIIIILIGISEILMAIWVLSKYKSRVSTIAQIIIVITMNIIEFKYASSLLLWGKLNIVFAMLFVTVVYINEFKLNQNPS